MTPEKSDRKRIVNLRSGMFCHFFPEHLLISSDKNSTLDLGQIRLHKTRNIKKLRLFLNVLYTLSFVAICFYTGFYPVILLLFVSLYDLRQLKRYYLPINRSKVIPISDITHFEIGKGGLNLNYFYIFIEHEGIQSMVPLRLYDSESTLLHAIALAESTGKKVIKPNDPKSISGPYYPLSETAGYVLDNNRLYYLEHKTFKGDRTDNYQYLRVFSWVLVGIGLSAIAVKINLITQRPFRPVDAGVFVVLLLLLRIPYPYLFKALPNEFDRSDITAIKETKRHFILTVKEGRYPKKVYFSKKWSEPETKNLMAK